MGVRSRSRKKRRDPAPPARRRKSQTQAERLASLRWNINDAKEALQNAVAMERWDTVIKYAKQIQALESKVLSSSQLGARRKYDPRRPFWMNRMTTEQHEKAEQARRRGRRGVP